MLPARCGCRGTRVERVRETGALKGRDGVGEGLFNSTQMQEPRRRCEELGRYYCRLMGVSEDVSFGEEVQGSLRPNSN